MTCAICLEDFNINDNRNCNNTRLICGMCNNPFHIKCLKFLIVHNCPLCRTNWRDANYEVFNEGYIIKVIDNLYNGEPIKIIEDSNCSVKHIIEKIAESLGNNDENINSKYYNLRFDPSPIVLYRDDAILDMNHIIRRNNPGNLTIRINNENWKSNMEKLQNNNYLKLFEFFNSRIIDGKNSYEDGKTLYLCINLFQPVATRGGSIIDDEIEDEILEVLKDAVHNNRSIYEALRYEFF